MSDHHDDESVNSTLTWDVNLLSPGLHVSTQQEQEQDSRLPYRQPCAISRGVHSEQERSEQEQVHRQHSCAISHGVNLERSKNDCIAGSPVPPIMERTRNKNDCIADIPVPPVVECTWSKNDRSNNDSLVPPLVERTRNKNDCISNPVPPIMECTWSKEQEQVHRQQPSATALVGRMV